MSTYETRLKQRKAQFVERARERLARLKENLEMLAANPEKSHLWQPVMKEFHQLAAAAGIYEITELCRLAVDTEDKLIAAEKQGTPCGKQEIVAVVAVVDAMDEILRAISAENGASC